MHQRKSKKIIIYLFLLIIVSTIGNNSINNLRFNKIQNIKISGLESKNNQILLKKIKNLSIGNIFFVKKNEITKLINSNSLIESFTVSKEYPSTINIKIERTNFLAKINKDGKIFLIGSNGKLTLVETGYNELPYVFGKPNVDEFLEFKKVIDMSKFSYNQIKSIYFFPSRRWDLKLSDNTLLKLPHKLTQENLNKLYKFLEDYSGEKFTTVDARLENKIILNE